MDSLLHETSDLINSALSDYLGRDALSGEHHRPPNLLSAMRHGVLNGGKRLRPFLLIRVASLFDVSVSVCLPTACALELVHCYSLIHDDLPAMDDDDLRRGSPTVHKLYGEADAILAGDALLTLSFDILSRPEAHPDSSIRLSLIRCLSRASGIGGMVGGQSLDMASESDSDLGESDILRLQAMKTGGLIRFACEAGGILGGASESELSSLIKFGELCGLAYQLSDDLLDITASEEVMGKRVLKDKDRNKGNLLTLYGESESHDRLHQLSMDAKKTLDIFDTRAAPLIEIIDFIISRTH